jgi:SAM-dependent methyltransferase
MQRRRQRVDYDRIASTYDRRYQAVELRDVASALRSLVRKLGSRRILEVGCGTGRWQSELQADSWRIFGVDVSRGMLAKAKQRPGRFFLLAGSAGELPCRDGAFDFVFAVNALHHFDPPRSFLSEAHRVLRPGGAVSVVGLDPRLPSTRWYLYDNFQGTLETDLKRYPPTATIAAWMNEAGFTSVEVQLAEHLLGALRDRAVFDDPFLQKDGTSQLVLLSDEAYQAGMKKIAASVDAAERAGEAVDFHVDLSLMMVTGRVAPE